VDGMPDTRARVWNEAWVRIQESPWIGHGPYYFTGVDERNVHSNYPHSLFLFLAHMIGIPGAIIFYGFLFAIIRRGYRAARAFATERSQFAYTVVILSSCMIIFLIDEMKISFLRYDQTQQFTWTMFALVLAASRVAMKRVEERKKENLHAVAQKNATRSARIG
jgi:O-antigen ligase